MTDATLVFVNRAGELVVNFGVFSGREATPAEIYRLGERLLRLVPSLEIVAEQRYEFDRQVEATVYQLRLNLDQVEGVVDVVQDWAEDCIAERHSPLSPSP
jgi:hypothetical protein